MTFLSHILLLSTLLQAFATLSPNDPLATYKWDVVKEGKFPMTDREVEILLRYDARVRLVTPIYWENRSNNESVPRSLRRAMGKQIISDSPTLSPEERRFASIFLPHLY